MTSRLLSPSSVAIVGLSDDPRKHGARVLASLRKLGFPGTVWGVNPRRPEVDGVEVVASLADLPASPDLVACAVPAPVVPSVVADAASVGAGAVVVFAGGFAESGEEGRALQRRLVQEAVEGGVRVLGPNSGGVIRPGAGLAVSFLTCLDRPAGEMRSGPVALVTQSGGTGSYVHNLAAERGGGLAVSVSTGNEADLGVADGIRAVTELDGVRAVAVVLETVRDGAAFVEAVLETVSSGIPVVVCRIGTSDRGTAMTATHTGAMARPARILDGVLDALGVTVAETPGEMLDVAEVMARTAVPAGDRVGVVTHSGGIAILLSDLAEREGVDLPILGDGLRRRLDSLLDHGTASNPLDMGGIIGGPGRFGEVVDAFDRSGEFDLVVATSTAHPRAHTVERVHGLLESQSDRVIHLWMAGDVGREGLDMLRAADRPVTEEPRALVRAVAGLVRMRRVVEDVRPVAETPGEPTGASPSGEFESKRFLAEWGVPVPEGGRAATAEEAAAVAERLGGQVVVKLDSPDILHKTEIGGVRVGIEGGAAAAEAFTSMTEAARTARPEARVSGVVVERRTSGFEVILGGVDDPLFGPMMLVGLGGIAAEGFGPPAIAPAPLSLQGAARLVDRAPGLAHALSRIGADAADALAELMSATSIRFAASDVEEFEVNPLAWTGDGWMALDAIVNTAADAAGNGSET